MQNGNAKRYGYRTGCLCTRLRRILMATRSHGWQKPRAILTILLVSGPVLIHCSGALGASLGHDRIKTAGPGFEPEFACVPYSASVYNPDPRGSSRTVSAHGLTPARFYRTEYDGGGFWNPDLPTRLTVPADGLYAVRLRANFEVRNPAPFRESVGRRLVFALNGTEERSRTFRDSYAERGYWPTLESEILLEMNAGQFVEVFTQQTEESGHEMMMAGVDLAISRVCD